MQNREGEPIVSRKLRDATIRDYLLPIPFQEFAVQPMPLPSSRIQPLEMIANVSSFVNNRNISDTSLVDSQVVMLLTSDDSQEVPRLAIQLSARNAVAREYIPVDKQEEALDKTQVKFPREYNKLLDSLNTPGSQPPVVETPDAPHLAWWRVTEMRRNDESYDFLATIIEHAPSNAIRIEAQERHGVDRGVDAYNWMQYEDRLLSERYVCSLVEIDNKRVIQIAARIPMFVNIGKSFTEGNYFDLIFYLSEKGIQIPEDVTRELLDDISSSESRPKTSHWGEIDSEAVERELKRHWRDVATPMLHIVGQKNARKHGLYIQEYRKPKRYAVRGFGQEIFRSGYGSERSIRIMDAGYDQPTVRTEEEVNAKLNLSDKKFERQQRAEKEFHERWISEILPSSRSWSEESISEAGRFLVENRQEPLDLLQARLIGDTRLAIIGEMLHPLQDDLLVRAVQELPIDFIVVEAKAPGEQRELLKEQTVFGEVELAPGIVVEMNAEEARQHEGYKDPTKPSHGYDSLIARARLRNLDIIYAPSGKTWKGENELITEAISEYMNSHPDAKGVYFASLLRSLAWPGYKRKQGIQKIGFMRPFVNYYSIANAHLSDISLRMPGYELKDRFPGEVYTLAQFSMPEGYGVQWRNLRQAVEASGLKDRFALDAISDSPFAAQWYLFDPLHAQEAGVPDEELYKLAGPINIEWEKLIDGVVVHPPLKKN